ncbi:glycosyltransferase [Falsarthrobacter nasiphocae]|uniref:Rhamnopyranosyl-N-acetylglucosaminyl-diphospho-decaprenol beta-1,3/1,4-galactofuranosyltransferase n=2 Tax=Falsarthrobacter nasiphocae TaxID=189863 RepID=A0AAE3YG20_9MICC|nr:glycosyltransferase [Falsarthrobacter nasiphocae]MDR6892769.1 rhamnopyranosyl-N-acetylglucosaminyl-diphospho-decaprenol beta-1,3/1,4-galactofuranosyltransferase [Falsarthrobacter nasiphocae]
MPLLDADSVAVAAVTYNRPQDLAVLLGALGSQSQTIVRISVVDSGTQPASDVLENARPGLAAAGTELDVIRSEANLGGAGGFSLAILHALASGAQWVWIMDDDARPEDPDCLSVLLSEARARSLPVVLPIVASPEDERRLSFGFRLDGRLEFSRNAVERKGFLPDVGHFFNGALVHRDVFFRVGLPDLKLFIRGDETDFMLRLRRADIPFGTVSTTALRHPTGWSEVRPVLGERWHVLVPDTAMKREAFFRNRGYLIRRHRRLKSFVADAVGYPVHFARTRDLAGLREWSRPFLDGLRGRGFSAPEAAPAAQPGQAAPRSAAGGAAPAPTPHTGD